MQQVHVDLVSVLIAAVIYMVVGFLWYSKWLFGSAWQKLSNLRESDMKSPGKATFFAALNALVIAYFLAFFESYLGVTTVADGMFVAFTIWLGFVVTTQLTPVIWDRSPPKLFLLSALCKLVSYVAMGAVIGA